MATQDETRPVFLPVIIGTPRQGRLTEPAANFVFGEVSKRGDTETELIDIRKIPVRIDDAGEALKNSEFSATVARADGLILVVPEYRQMSFCAVGGTSMLPRSARPVRWAILRSAKEACYPAAF